jgi:hypothetical protein
VLGGVPCWENEGKKCAIGGEELTRCYLKEFGIIPGVPGGNFVPGMENLFLAYAFYRKKYKGRFKNVTG